jgi:hypothetical protein
MQNVTSFPDSIFPLQMISIGPVMFWNLNHAGMLKALMMQLNSFFRIS